MAKQDVLNTIHRYIQRVEHEGIPVSFAVLYGSHAHGKPHTWSDIDLIIVSTRFDAKRKGEDSDLLWYLAALVDSRIEPIACGLKQWEHDEESAIIEIARREGQQIFPVAPELAGNRK